MFSQVFDIVRSNQGNPPQVGLLVVTEARIHLAQERSEEMKFKKKKGRKRDFEIVY